MDTYWYMVDHRTGILVAMFLNYLDAKVCQSTSENVINEIEVGEKHYPPLLNTHTSIWAWKEKDV